MFPFAPFAKMFNYDKNQHHEAVPKPVITTCQVVTYMRIGIITEYKIILISG
jgi:hypothetical protein